ncbi:hypothetical protein HHI36_006559 [Cryptolaemus montrouzieri]|uniref:Uncharacterized protein n=1 Tax=Cryptolaemus montrouzieri TaxID=559131 RepID=A0ABD2NXG6_9CUCU
MIFGRSEPSVTKFNFSLKADDIVADIKNISHNVEQRSQLYSCLDSKPQQEQKFDKIEEFLKESTILEETSEELSSLVDDIKNLEKNVTSQVDKLSDKCTVFC